jgi:glycine betaine transporter
VQRDRSEVGTVFWVSAAFALAFILWGVLSPETFGVVTQTIFDWVVTNLGWFTCWLGTFSWSS